MYKFIFLCFSFLFIFGCSDAPGSFTLEAETIAKYNPDVNGYRDVTVLYITSKVDDLVIENVIANRGNCSLSYGTRSDLPSKLKFGSRQRIRFLGRCTVSEVEVITDDGEWTFTF